MKNPGWSARVRKLGVAGVCLRRVVLPGVAGNDNDGGNDGRGGHGAAKLGGDRKIVEDDFP